MRQSLLLSSALAFLLVACETPPTAESGTPASSRAAPALAFPPESHAYGHSLAEWNQRWWRWALSIPAPVNPSLDPLGVHCAEGQEGPAWYLGSSFGSATVERSCTVPAGKAILVNLSSLLNDYPCPDPNFQPAPGQSLEAFLAEGARQVEDGVNQLSLAVDGVPVPDLFGRRAPTGLFSFTGDVSLQAAIDPCITGTEQQAVSDGFFALLKPLPVGEHTITFGAATAAVQTSLTYHINVVRDDQP
jgi:hypothetical protein